MFKKINKNFFSKNLFQAGIQKQVVAAQQLDIVREVLKELFGEGAEQHAKPKYIKNRSLTIEIAHPAIGERIRQEEKVIVSEVNKRIGYQELLRIHFMINRNENEYSE